MDPTVLVSLITATGGVITALIGFALKRVVQTATDGVAVRNTEEHLMNKEILERIEDKVDRVEERQIDHLTWHATNPHSTKGHAA